jgi:hypothetical protein
MKLVREKGIKLSEDFKMRPISMSDASATKEEKIAIVRAKKVPREKNDDTLARRQGEQKLPGGTPAVAPADAAVPPRNGAKGLAPDAPKGKTVDTLKMPRAEKDARDVWGMQALGRDTSAKTQVKNSDGKARQSETDRRRPDTLAAKAAGAFTPPPPISAQDSTAGKTSAAPKPAEKADPVSEIKKTKSSRKTAPAAGSSEDKDW